MQAPVSFDQLAVQFFDGGNSAQVIAQRGDVRPRLRMARMLATEFFDAQRQIAQTLLRWLRRFLRFGLFHQLTALIEFITRHFISRKRHALSLAITIFSSLFGLRKLPATLKSYTQNRPQLTQNEKSPVPGLALTTSSVSAFMPP